MAAHLVSTLPAVDVPTAVSVPDYVLRDAATYGQRVALIDASSGQRLTYRKLISDVLQLASSLFTHFQPYQKARNSHLGSRRPIVCLYAAASLRYPIVFHAVLQAKGSVTTASPSLSPDELVTQFKLVSPDFIIADSERLKEAVSAAAKVDTVKEIFVLDKFVRGYVSIDELLQNERTVSREDVIVDYLNDVAILPFDCDERGEIRAVLHSHSSFLANVSILSCPDMSPVLREDIVCCCHPISSMVGLVFYCGVLLRTGATAVLLPAYSDTAMLQAISKYKASLVHTTPAAVHFLSRHAALHLSDLSSLRRLYCSGDPLREGQITDLLEKTMISEVRDSFSVSGAVAITSVRQGYTRQGSVGQVCPNTAVEVRDILFDGVMELETFGEICVRGPQVMVGQICKSEPEVDPLQNGWFHTGYIGKVDDTDNFSLLGKIEELIDYDSFQVAPVELEAVIRQHPDVIDVIVVGVDQHDVGQVPRACVIKNPESDVTSRDIAYYVAGLVPDHKRLRGGVVFVDDLPRSETGEALRHKLQTEQAGREVEVCVDRWDKSELYSPDDSHTLTPGVHHLHLSSPLQALDSTSPQSPPSDTSTLSFVSATDIDPGDESIRNVGTTSGRAGIKDESEWKIKDATNESTEDIWEIPPLDMNTHPPIRTSTPIHSPLPRPFSPDYRKTNFSNLSVSSETLLNIEERAKNQHQLTLARQKSPEGLLQSTPFPETSEQKQKRMERTKEEGRAKAPTKYDERRRPFRTKRNLRAQEGTMWKSTGDLSTLHSDDEGEDNAGLSGDKEVTKSTVALDAPHTNSQAKVGASPLEHNPRPRLYSPDYHRSNFRNISASSETLINIEERDEGQKLPKILHSVRHNPSLETSERNREREERIEEEGNVKVTAKSDEKKRQFRTTRNLRKQAGAWKSTGDLSTQHSDVEDDGSGADKDDTGSSKEVLNTSYTNSETSFSASLNARMRSSTYSRQVRLQEIGMLRAPTRSLSNLSLHDKFGGKSVHFSSSGRLLYSSETSSYRSGYRSSTNRYSSLTHIDRYK